MLFLDPVNSQPLEGKELWEARAHHLQQLIVAYDKVLQGEQHLFAYKGQIIWQVSAEDKAKLVPIKDDLQTQIQDFVANEFFNPENK